ncbi:MULTISPECIES: flagellar filament capping protein FliD [unclassified Marinimicrobium]|jgi:flagellar hook-associated protein 2|uniref:flagellar filament capping protein FliD n=3 Tax=Marinimicrobium TaxID=359337 RepID=UPI00257EC659|nr:MULTISPECIES: flagellar filament capping protein FliD [unclassified Marinimicrobium]|tara:strand:+ start:169 stop:2181 length:2013 start_codon:yes stop_codon:yes gene_type:complete
MASIGSDIINRIGGGSGVNTSKLVDDLVGLQQAPEEQRLETREQRIDAQISGYGLLRSAVSDLDSAVQGLANEDTFNAKQASISDNSLMAVNELNPDAVPGNYRVRVSQVAQSQSLASGTFASLNDEVGTGTLNLRFGDWDGSGNFTLAPVAEGASIEIDDSNNSLTGLRDAINKADIGVQASIVGQEGNYQLLLTSPTGAQRELEITATEDAGALGLAQFNYNEVEQGFTQQQEGKDAILSVNGLEVTRTTNTIDDVIDGMTFDILNADPAQEISINVSEDRALAETAIRDFVEAYNTFVNEMQRLRDTDTDEDGQGSLNNDSLAGNLMRSVRGQISAAVPGLDQGIDSLASIGIRTRLDGTLEFADDGEDTDFSAVFSSQFEAIRDLFVPSMESSNARITPSNFGNRTQSGTYEVEITQDATRGFLTADPATMPLDVTSDDYSFTIEVNGRESAMISLPQGSYASLEDVATELQTLINADSNLREGGARVNVTVEGGALKFESNTYGRDSSVAITSVGANAGALGLSEAAGTTGLDVAGTINGEEGFGYGRILRGALRSPAEGLALEIADGASTATVNFSRGFGSGLLSTLDTYVRNSGLISERESTLKDDRVEVSEAREAMERRSEAYRARLEAQFLNMERIVRSLNSTGSFLEGINDRLPFTAPPR